MEGALSGNQGPLDGVVSNGGFPDLDLSFFILFGTLPIFPGFSRLVLLLFLGRLEAPTRNILERVRDLQDLPEKVETPWFSFSQGKFFLPHGFGECQMPLQQMPV